jgi:uncharacterized protein CbrC (UPF0167 family)
MATFSDLGIPFPLFEAPTNEACGYVHPAVCRLCRSGDRHCFEVGHLILPCPACCVENGLRAYKREDSPCRSCGSIVSFPEPLKAKKQLLVCYDCLRAGKAAMTKSTEYGTVTWEQAFNGVTLGVPGLKTDQFETVPIDPEEDWYGVRIPSEHLWELLRTPDFYNWQEERWLFCCRHPMTYMGGWRSVLESIRPSDPRGFFEGLFGPDDGSPVCDWEEADVGNVSVYVYRCKSCGRYRATWDSD